MPIWLSIVIIFLLFAIGGVFSAAEMALVSLRDSQVKSLARRGSRGRAIQELTSNPNRFLSAVQIGVTLAGFLSSAFGSDSLAGAWVAPAFESWGVPHSFAGVLAVIVITGLISFCSIVISELFSKRLALQRPEEVALGLAPFVNGVATIFRPLIWALGVCTNLLVRLAGFDPNAGKEAVSDEELRSMVINADSLDAEAKHIVDEVFSAGDRSLREVMIPRTEVDFLPGTMPVSLAVSQVQGGAHSRYPVIDGSPDRVLGFVHVRDLMAVPPETRDAPVSGLARPVLRLPETVRVPRALADMRRGRSHLAVVLDEYGGTAGIITLEDLVEELVGDITDEYDVIDDNTRKHRQQRDIDGLTTLEEFADAVGYVLPEGPYDTVAGYFMAQRGEIPAVGDSITVRLAPAEPVERDDDDEGEAPEVGDDFEMRVTQMDGRRVAWLNLRAVLVAADAGQTAADPAVEAPRDRPAPHPSLVNRRGGSSGADRGGARQGNS
ncbi:hemolysin family protein [Propionibacterium sp.]|uniref:hemolysin family protein n=1 Tax=Propionibacterium sp. TaxID=1977903 RepID=UPI0039EAF3FD